MINMVKLPTNKSSLFLRVAKGHFATSHSHINYYIDVTTQKARLSEAKAVAKELVAAYQHSTIVDTVLCLDGTQVIGTCLANELTKDGFANMNAHQTIYVITPEYTSGSQISLRDNLAPMVRGKHVLILSASITTGYTVQAAIEASGLRAQFPDIDLAPGSVGVWGRKAPLEQTLRARDRVEIWRPLRVDPKLALVSYTPLMLPTTLRV